MNDVELAELICEYGKRLYMRGLVSGHEGNISARTEKGSVIITPSRESKGYMTPDMLVELDMNGNVINDNGFKASSESRLHLNIYLSDPEVKAVVHAHPPYTTAFSCGGRVFTTELLAEAGVLFGESVPCVPFADPGSVELAESVKPHIKDNTAILLANHGAVCFSREGIKDALFRIEMLESCIRTDMIYRNK